MLFPKLVEPLMDLEDCETKFDKKLGSVEIPLSQDPLLQLVNKTSIV